jgi:hypothetical protein
MRFTELSNEDIHLSDYYNKKITISGANKKPLRFQIPRMYIPFGLSGFTPEIGSTKWNIDFSMKGWDEEDNYVKKFYDFVRNIEKYVCDNIQQNSNEIFGNSDIDLKNMFNSNIKEDHGREPKFRIKVDTDLKDMIKPKFFDINEKDITGKAERGLYQKYSGVSIVEISSVYFLNKKIGLTWRLFQMKVFEPQRLRGFQFIENEVDDDVKLEGFQFLLDAAGA